MPQWRLRDENRVHIPYDPDCVGRVRVRSLRMARELAHGNLLACGRDTDRLRDVHGRCEVRHLYLIYTRHAGWHEVRAESHRHAVAALVARLGLTEEQTAQVVSWSVAELAPAKKVTGGNAVK